MTPTAVPSESNSVPREVAPPTAAPGADRSLFSGGDRRLTYDGASGQLYRIFFRNLMFNILTLGLYHPWAKTNYRRYLWSRVSFLGDRFEYTGTGKELFKGMIIGSVLMMVLYFGGAALVSAVGSMYGQGTAAAVGFGLFATLGIFVMELARFSARRYRYSRTVWRGIRLGLHGSAMRYGLYGMVQGLLTLATLGLYLPWAQSNLTSRMARATSLGAEHLGYDGTGRGLIKPWLVTLILLLPTFGLITVWYRARAHRYIAEHTTLQGARFASDVTYRKLISLISGNWALTSFTFGLGGPLVFHRNMGFLCARHSLHGHVDFGTVQQGTRQTAGDAEGISEVLELGDIGFG
ncbi:MAG: YjgN family protein [Nitrospirota bacterium]|nr:YjgN family protein [Nitrospirota bacterium]